MTVTLNRRAFDHAKELISEGRIVLDERDAWSEHRPTAEQENELICLHGFAEYGRWYLGISDEKPEQQRRDTTNFPMGISARSIAVACSRQKAAPAKTSTMTSKNAVAHLHGMLDARKGAPASKRKPPASPRKTGARRPTFGATAPSLFQRFTTQSTRLNSTLSRRHVISGK